jgi:hypothetical protein
MKFLTVLLFGFSLAAQVNPTVSASLLAVGITHAVTPNPALTRSLVTVEPRPTAPQGRSLYLLSVAILGAAGAADVASSWRRPEANPVVAGPGSTFGVGSVAIKLGLVGSSFVLERLALRRRPDLYRHIAWMNFGIAGAQAAVVRHNMGLR